MLLISDADVVLEKLIQALADETSDRAGLVCTVVDRDLIPALRRYDPAHLVEVGMRAIIRDVQDWLGTIEHNRTFVDLAALDAYLSTMLTTVGVGDATPVS